MSVVLNAGVDEEGVARIILNRPNKGNALDNQVFEELPRVLSSLDKDPQVRVVVLSGAGSNFCSGIDLNILSSRSLQKGSSPDDDGARSRNSFASYITWLQQSLSSPETCSKPVIAMIHGGCIGAGVDLITSCDLRFCTKSSVICVKEVDLGITADLGTLQRLPGIVGYAKALELALTARSLTGAEAKEMGLVSEAFDSQEAMEAGVMKLAREIARKSPLAVQGSKNVLVKGRDMSVSQALEYVALRNAGLLSFQDVQEAIDSLRNKRKPVFAKL